MTHAQAHERKRTLRSCWDNLETCNSISKKSLKVCKEIVKDYPGLIVLQLSKPIFSIFSLILRKNVRLPTPVLPQPTREKPQVVIKAKAKRRKQNKRRIYEFLIGIFLYPSQDEY